MTTGSHSGEAEVQAELPRIALFEADPDLLRHVVPEEAERARRALTVPLVVIPSGEFDPAMVFEQGTRPFAALVVSGLVTREVTFGGQPTLVLLGPGDLLHPLELNAGLLSARQAWAASGTVRVALLGDRFLQAVRNWPRILTGLAQRLAERNDDTLVQLAVSQQPRVEDRLVDLFRHLAERWGRVTPEGVVVPLSLTHEALGRIIGARRPTVTLALKALAAEERLHRRGDGAWVLQDVETPESPSLAALKGAARPAVVRDPEATPPADQPPTGTELVNELEWLRELHGELRERLIDLSGRSQANCRRSARLIEHGRRRRQRR